MSDARPYGEEWSNEVRIKALKALGAQKSLASLTVGLAQEADKETSADDLENKAAVVGYLARAARSSGMEALATTSESRLAGLDRMLDEQYHKTVPPFKPSAYPGRKDKNADGLVLMELFTGAQCPPCVAADVGFDGLLQSYKSTEFIGLQYHLHIPGPDPLTNRDAIARQEYYGSDVQGTPSTFSTAGARPAAEGRWDTPRRSTPNTAN